MTLLPLLPGSPKVPPLTVAMSVTQTSVGSANRRV